MSNRSRDKRAQRCKEFRVPVWLSENDLRAFGEKRDRTTTISSHVNMPRVTFGLENPIIDSATRSRVWKTPAKNNVSRDNLRLPRARSRRVVAR